MNSSKLNIDLLHQMLDEKMIVRQKHPHYPLYIYNYTANAQYERVWNNMTLQCRGLILDENYHIVARPFKKFFNLGEHENQIIPKDAFEVFEKMDGSLGILYWYDNEAFIATRGSFASMQAVKATEILKYKYASILNKLSKKHTYLFEIIYPENRIVLDYGGMEDLVLLAIIQNETGSDMPLVEIGFPLVKKYNGIHDIHTLKNLEENNKEGFVIQYENGYRLKVKFEEYLRIHRIVTQVSTISIWEYLASEQSLNELLERVPDEFYDWVKKTQNNLLQNFKEIEDICKHDFKELETRKETALYFQTCKYPSVLFSMLTHKNYRKLIWKMIRPLHAKPFSETPNE